MNTVMGKNISRLRKEQGLTQEELASLLNLSAQAVSKWENGQSHPDIELLPQLTDILETNIDSLLGHIPGDSKKTIYSEAYSTDDFYWGLQPNDMCYDLLKLCPPDGHKKLLEIGCGEGKDALFFARNGYDVTAFDIAQSGIDKLLKTADRYRVSINAFRADMMEYRLTEPYDIIYSSRSLHHIRPAVREKIIRHFQDNTKTGGYNVMNVFVDKPFIGASPEKDQFAFLWQSGEIFTYYAAWKMEKIDEIIYDCQSSGIPHQHAIDVMISQKIAINSAGEK